MVGGAWPRLLLGLTLLLASIATPTPRAGAGPHVALYFVGEPRTLNSTLCSILDNIVRPLMAEKCRLTFFIYTPRCPGLEQYDFLAAVPGVTVVTRVIDDPVRPSADCVKHLNTRVQLGIHAEYNEELLAHIRDMEGIDLERLAYEKAHAVQFAWAMFVRPDVTFVDPLPPLRSLSPGRLYVPSWYAFDGINDRFAIVPRQYTAPYFQLYSALCVDGLVKQLPSSMYNPERIYRWQLDRASVPLAALRDFFFVRTRTFPTHHGHLKGRDLALLNYKRCLCAFRYRCCTVALVAGRLRAARRNCTVVLDFAAKACRKYRRSAVREAVVAEQYAAGLLAANASSPVAVGAGTPPPPPPPPPPPAGLPPADALAAPPRPTADGRGTAPDPPLPPPRPPPFFGDHVDVDPALYPLPWP